MSWRPIIAVLALALVTSGCLDDGVPDLRTAPVVVRIDQLDGEGSLDACPIDDVASLLDDALDLVDSASVRSGLAGSPVAGTTIDTSGSAQLTCSLDGTVGQVTIDVARAPDNLGDVAATLGDRLGGTVEIDESREFRGGRFHRVCTIGETAVEQCGVAWIDDLASVAISVTGEGASQLDLGAVEERFAYVLPLIVDRLIDA